MIEDIVGSKVKVKLLRKMFEIPEREFTLDELSRVTKLSHGTVFPAIKSLEERRVVLTSKSGRSTLYRLNMANRIINEFKKIFLTEIEMYEKIAKNFVKDLEPEKCSKIKNIILFGSVAKGSTKLGSDVDLLFVTDEKDNKLEEAVQNLTQDYLEKCDVIISPLFLTEKQFNSNIDFVIRAKAEGVVLFERRKKR